jgi:diguanylate cyclase (GGDEF)-like protein/PAS domain S-box-containing protein
MRHLSANLVRGFHHETLHAFLKPMESLSEKITFLNQTTLECLSGDGNINILEKFTEAGIKVMGSDFGFAWVKNQNPDFFDLAYKSSLVPYEPMPPRNDGSSEAVIASKRPLLLSDYPGAKYFRPDAGNYIKSLAVIPIVYKDEIYGSIYICFKNFYSFTKEDESLCEFIGNSAAQAITIHRLVKSEQEARLEAESQQARFRALIENSYDTIALIDDSGLILDMSRSVTRMTGHEAKDLVGQKIHDLIHTDDLPALQNSILKSLQTPDAPLTLEVRYRHQDGSWHWLEARGLNMLENPDVKGIVANIRDITERKQAQNVIQHQALHDPLTDLPNRQEFALRFVQALENAKRNNHEMALMFLDLDRFKNVNDRLGHSVGDTVLKVIASRFLSCLRAEDVVARFGGDEFLILVSKINSPKDGAMVAEKILKAVSLPVKIGEHTLHPTVSIGIAIYPGDGQSMESVKKNADVALYRAKEDGRNRFSLYDRSMGSLQEAERFTLENEFREALEFGQIKAYYQPIISLKKGELVAVEALARWQHPSGKLLSPAEFIPLAEEAGLMKELDEYMLKKACAQSNAWQEMGLTKFRVAVNMSAFWLGNAGFPSIVAGILKDCGGNASNLEFEISESVAMGNFELTRNNLKELKKLGVRIAIDDFGTGYSSLSYLKRFPINTLKIDKSFIRHCITDAQDMSITKTIIAMAHTLHLKVVAEGVETLQQLELLESLGCDFAQGYYISQPIPPAELVIWLEEKSLKKKVAAR